VVARTARQWAVRHIQKEDGMLDRLRVIFGGFDWTNGDGRERAFRSTIATDALARAFGEWYFHYKRSSPDTALSLVSDAYMEILAIRGTREAELFLDIADPREI
jgi:hypothetical protein